MQSIANSLLHDVALVALCRGWPETLPLAALGKLPELIDADKPVSAWLFASKADAALMAKYVVRYPRKLMQDYFGEPRYGIEAVRGRLQTIRNVGSLFSLLFKRSPRPILGLPSPNCSHHRCAPSRHFAPRKQPRHLSARV